MYKLVISDDEGKTIIVPLVRDLITVGRQDGNTIRLTERNVSRAHARFVRDTSGYRIEDLDSYNGITVNGVRIEKTAELKDGDRVGVGDYVIALRAEASTGAAVTRSSARGSVPQQGFGAPPPARMVMISPPAPGAEFSMTKSAVSIGRLEELDLCISHRSISREHARVTQKAGGFEIEDLRSANGVRVNGASVKRSALRSGDLVELGQVRFRFVGQGEPYTYDPAEEQAALLAPSKTRPGKQTVWALVGAAALAGGVLAFCQDGSKQAGAAMSKETPPAQPPPAPASAALEPSTEELPDQAQLGALLETCKQNLENGAYAEALRAADQALALPGAGDEFTVCKRDVNDALRVRSAYEQGTRALAENKLEDAYFLFAGIPDDHSFRQKPEVKTATERVAQERLVKARKLLRSDPKETRELASSVLDMQDAPKAARDEAAQLVALASAPVAMAEPAPSGTPTSTVAPKPRPVASAQASDDDPAKTARNCLARGDQRCVVRALEGKAETAQELALLIETYRALGETKKAVKHMETFVARYASARQTPQYRQFIAKHEP
jgi:pSer/pThr/pTyr-binding forkhead associated (FHA) protein